MPTLPPLPRYGLAVMLALILCVGCSSSGDRPTATPTPTLTATTTPMPGATPTPTPTATTTPMPGATPTPTPTATPTPMPGSLDRDALVELYSATDGANWSSSSYWLSDAPIGEWLGVTTDASGRVTELFLEHNQLSGEIRAGVGQPCQPGGAGSVRQPVERGDAAVVGQPHQPERAVPLRQPVERGNSARSWATSPT